MQYFDNTLKDSAPQVLDCNLIVFFPFISQILFDLEMSIQISVTSYILEPSESSFAALEISHNRHFKVTTIALFPTMTPQQNEYANYFPVYRKKFKTFLHRLFVNLVKSERWKEVCLRGNF